MANVGTSTVAYATQQPTGSLVFIASDGTACVLWTDGTNQKFSYASSPYSSWTTTTLIAGLNMALGGEFRAGSDNIDLVTGASGTVRPNYYPLTKIGATYSLGTATQISTTVAGTSAVGNVMQYAGQDPQGRHWIVCGGASTYTTSRALNSPANSPTGTWTSNISTTQTGDVNQPAGDQIGNYLLKTYWNGTAIQYHRLDTSVVTLGAWSTAATIPNLTGSPNASSRVVFRALSSTQGLLVYSTGSGIYTQTYTPATDTWSTATQLSTNASDRHPAIVTDGGGSAWVLWCSFVAANNYALVYKKWDGATWDAAATTLIASGTNIANPNGGFGKQTIGVTYTQGTANPFTVGWATFSIIRSHTVPASAAFSSPDWYIPGWRSKKQLTLNHAQVSGGIDLVDFPVLISFTDVDFKTVANGGKVQNASGFDLIFLDSTQTTQLDHEMEKYDGVAGTITAWVRVPILSASVDTSIYCYLNNTSITTSRENKPGVWRNAYNGVWHLSETSGNNADSSGNGNDLTSITVTSRGVAAKIAGGNTFNNTTDVETTAASAASQLPASFTLSTWVKLTALPAAGVLAIFMTKSHTAAPWSSYGIYVDSSGKLHGDWYNASSSGFGTTGATTLVTGTWYRASMTFDNSSKIIQVYLNGVADQVSPTVASGVNYPSTGVFALSDLGGNKLNGVLDEPHLDAVVRTTGWQVTEYNNQNAPGTFCTPGATALVSYSPRSVPLSAALSGVTARTLPATVALLPAGTVTRSGSQLILNGTTFRFSGANIIWLGLIGIPSVAYPSHFAIDDGLTTAKEMGATVVRSHTLGISVGNSLSIEPSLGTFNDAAFEPIDYAIERAGQLGMKLVIPLTDNYHYYHGGKHTFTDWRSLSDETLFYTDSTVIADFEAYISHILNHVNTYTSVALKNDPTIMAWETGNELNGAPAAWTNTITTYIKSIDVMHLVLAGDTVQGAAAGAVTTELAEANLDLLTDHFYPPDTSELATNQAAVTPSSKVYIVGEYDWTDQDSAAATFAIDATDRHGGTYSAKITVTASAIHVWHVQLFQSGFALAAATYTVSFWAKASVACSLEVAVQEGHDAFTVYTQQSVNLTTSWALYTLTSFTMSASDANVLLSFNCAAAVSTIWIDDVNINSGGANLLTNPGFETGAFSPWVTKVVPSSTLAAFLTAIEGNSSIAGDLFWVIYPHADSYGFVINNDILIGSTWYTYSLYYPGQTASQQTNAQALRTHAYTMSGLSVPAALTPAAPANLTVVSNAVSWQGVVGAKTYDVERSTTSGSSGFSVIGTGLTDFSTPWTDATAGSFTSKWYRVRGYNTAAVAGTYSSVVFVGSPSRTIGASAALIGTNTRSIPASAALITTKTRTVGAMLATLATSTRTVPASGALLSSPTRTVGSGASLIGTLTRSISASVALLLTRTRTLGASATLAITSTRQVSSTVAMLATGAHTVPASGVLQGQASRVIPISAALSITRVIPTSTALSLTQARTIAASTPLSLTQARQIGASSALLATSSRTVPATGALQRQASRSIPATGALSAGRVVPASVALLLASSRVIPASVALTATSTRTIGSSAALLSTRSRQLATSAALLASFNRSIGVSSALLGTRTRTIPTDAALSLTGTATRTIPASAALLTSASRNVGASAALGLSNVSRTVPTASALLQQASRSIPASTPLQATASRQVAVSAALLAVATRGIPSTGALLASLTRTVTSNAALVVLTTATRTIPATGALLSTVSRSVPTNAALGAFDVSRQLGTSAALLQQRSRSITQSAALVATSTRIMPTSAACLSQASRNIPASFASLATRTRSIGASGALASTFTRAVTTDAALSLLGTKFRSIPTSATLSGGSRVLPASTALTLSASRSIPGSGALLVQKTRVVLTSVALGASSTRGIASSAAVSGTNVRAVPVSAVFIEVQTRSIVCTVSLAFPVPGTQLGIPASVALSSTSTRFVVCMVALLASNATVRFRSGTADVRVRSGTVSLIVS